MRAGGLIICAWQLIVAARVIDWAVDDGMAAVLTKLEEYLDVPVSGFRGWTT
jgi:hypothetical protein